MPTNSEEIARILAEHPNGREALDLLIPFVYNELRQRARNYFRNERPGQTLQPTALVHEAFHDLARLNQISWHDRNHLIRLASGQMRRILVNRARAKKRAKRGGAPIRVSFSNVIAVLGVPPAVDVDILALNEAMDRLEALSERQARVVECRYFGGLTIEETAAVLGVRPATVKTDWAAARLFLLRELERTAPQ